MALSGSFQGSNKNIPYLTVQWDVLEQDVVGNRSRVRFIVSLTHVGWIRWAQKRTGTIKGTGVNTSYSIGDVNRQSSGTFELGRSTVWVSHNSSGNYSNTISVSQEYNLKWGETTYPAFTASGTMNIDSIGRATTIKSVSADSTLNPNSTTTVSLELENYNSNFTIEYKMYVGSGSNRKNVYAVSDGGNRTSLSFSTTRVEQILEAMPTTKSTTITLEITTRVSPGGTIIGSVQSATFTVSVHESSTRPSFTSVSTSIAGSGHDKSINRYVRTISKVSAGFDIDWGHGANAGSSNITVDGNSFGSYSNGRRSGTSRVLNTSGTRTVTFTATNSRNQTHSVTRSITVLAYSPPSITTLRATRRESPATTVDIQRATSFTTIGDGLNRQRATIERRRVGTTSYSNIVTLNWTTGNISNTSVSTGNNTSYSYDFRFTVTDEFGKSASSVVTVSTGEVLMDLWQGQGVGIGKYWERGTLDVAKSVYIDGHELVSNTNENLVVYSKTDSHLYMRADMRGSGNLYLSGDTIYIRDSSTGTGHRSLQGYIQNAAVENDSSIIESGSNEKGHYVKYYDGTQICWNDLVEEVACTNARGALFRSPQISPSWALSFTSTPAVSITTRHGNDAWGTAGSVTAYGAFVYAMSPIQGATVRVGYIAVGRWK